MMFVNVLLQIDLPLPSGIANKTIGFEGLTKEASHLKYPFLSSCNISPRCKFRKFGIPQSGGLPFSVWLNNINEILSFFKL
jgi:hypothetical protein